MTPRHRVSPAAITLIKRFEGYRRTAAQLPDGRWTIGHGHTLTARKGAEVSPDDAEALLHYDLIGIAHGLTQTIYTPLNQNQFDALASFTFNIGLDRFGQSDVLKRLNEGALIQAACAMELWRKALVGGEPVVIDALVRRRAVEKALFLTPPDAAWVPAPSPVLRPLLDSDALGTVPRDAPAPVVAPMDGEATTVLHDVPGDAAEPVELEDQGPAKAAAEAVTARLHTLFPDEAPAASVDAAPGEEETFRLTPPDEHDDAGADLAPTDDDDAIAEPGGPDMFDAPPANDLQTPATPASDTDAEAPEDAAVTEEPFEFLRPMTQPLPEEPRTGGLIGLLTLGLVGLAFFAGGIFWATNAGPTPAGGLDPRLVGWLAGLAGVGFFAVATYLLLERLGRASERAARRR